MEWWQIALILIAVDFVYDMLKRIFGPTIRYLWGEWRQSREHR